MGGTEDISTPDRTEIELIKSLFDAVVPAIIMSVGFVAAGVVMLHESRDPLLFILLVVGGIASVCRVAVSVYAAAQGYRGELTLGEARRMERRFATAYIAFAACLGLFGARTFQVGHPSLHMLSLCLLIGYGAGVAATVGLRPRIAVPAMIIAIVPTIGMAFATGDAVYHVVGGLTLAFLGGGINSLRGRHARFAEEVSRRITYSKLAREDVLTELPNRLALREWFDEKTREQDRFRLVALHCLDLNGFKPVNDNYGHPVGDALLVAVAGRVSECIRGNDFVARLGGDEFVVVQSGVAGEMEARLLAQRLIDSIAAPFDINGHRIIISTCVGYVLAGSRSELEHLLAVADSALYRGKEMRRLSSAHNVPQRAAA